MLSVTRFFYGMAVLPIIQPVMSNNEEDTEC